MKKIPTTKTLESNSLWRRKHGSFQHIVYELITDDGGSVNYIVRNKSYPVFQIPKELWVRDFRKLTIDETLEECPIL